MSPNEIDAARLLLARLGITPQDLLESSASAGEVPTFGDYIPRVRAVVTPGTLRTYGPYWKRIDARWHDRQLTEPTAMELKELVEHTRRIAVMRRNSRGGRSAAETMASAIRCLYRHAREDGYIPVAGDPAAHVHRPRRARSTRTALSDYQLAQINRVVATTGNDIDLDALIMRLHIETACRLGGALALRPRDLDRDNCLIRLREKAQADRWQPVSPTLMHALLEHCSRGAEPDNQLLRYGNGRPITRRRYDHIWERIGRHLSWVATLGVTTHWVRHTTLTWVDRNFGYPVARSFAGHAEPSGDSGATLIYTRASLTEVCQALAALTGEPHPMAPEDDTKPKEPPMNPV